MKFKKLNLTLGTLAVVTAPIAAVVACGANDTMNDNNPQIFKDLTSEQAQKFLEKEWLIAVIKSFDQNFDGKDILKNSNVKELVKFFLSEELRKDSSFLNKTASNLIKLTNNSNNPIFNTGLKDKKDLFHIGMLRNWTSSNEKELFEEMVQIEGESFKRIDLIADVLISEASTQFANNILKHLVVSEYLKSDHKTWEDFTTKKEGQSERLTRIEEKINKDKYFLLIKKMLEKKLFFKWEVKEAKGQNQWLNSSDKTLEEAIKEFQKSKNDEPTRIIDQDTRDAQNQNLNKAIWDLTITLKRVDDQGQETNEEFTINANDLLGFKGVSTQETGSGLLEFTLQSLQQLEKNSLVGIIQNKNIVNKEIKLIEDKEDNRNASLSFGVGIMPVWNSEKGHLTLDGSRFEKNIDNLTWLIYSQDQSIFNEALKFFAGDKDKGGKDIKIKVHDALLHYWKEVRKLEFVK